MTMRGGWRTSIDVVGVRVPLQWVALTSVTTFIKNGQLKALAVSTEKRTPVMPDIPSAAETVEGFNVDSWYAVFAPAGTPDAIVQRFSDAIAQVTQDSGVQQSFMAQGAVAVGSKPGDLDAIVTKEIPMWKELAQK